MKRLAFVLGLGIGFLASLCVPFLHAADTPAPLTADEKIAAARRKLALQFDGGDRYAVVVGINHYLNPNVHSLRWCVQDAGLLADVLVKRCSYPKDHLVLLNDNQPDDLKPTKINVLREIDALQKRAKKGDTVMFYYAGHGDLALQQSFIDVCDIDPENMAGTAIKVEDVRTRLRDCAATQKLLILDCCHSGTVQGGLGFSGEDIGDKKSAGGLITFAGCRRGQTSQESAEVGHGLLTYCLARGLAGEADFDHDGIVDSDEIYRFLFQEVPTMAQKMSPPQQQTPVRIIGEDVTGLFAIARVTGEAIDLKIPPKVNTGDTIANSLGMKLAIIKPGKFKWGSPPNEYGRNDDERQREVEIDHPFYMSTCEVTQAQYQLVMGNNPSYFSAKGEGASEVEKLDTSDFPVEQVSWDEAKAFCAKLSKMTGERASGLQYRLPSEVEWEFACRAGTTTAFNTGDLLSSKDANVNGERPYLNSPDGPSLKRTTKVASYKPNAWGLYDMHGNTWEWCEDHYTENPRMNGLFGTTGPDTGSQRVIRGGAFSGDVSLACSAQRRNRDPDYKNKTIGFRIVGVPVTE